MIGALGGPSIGSAALAQPMLLDLTATLAPLGWVVLAWVGTVVAVLLAAIARDEWPPRGRTNVVMLPLRAPGAGASA